MNLRDQKLYQHDGFRVPGIKGVNRKRPKHYGEEHPTMTENIVITCAVIWPGSGIE